MKTILLKKKLFTVTCFVLLSLYTIAQEDNSKGQTTQENDLLELSLEDLMNLSIESASKKKEKMTEAPATVAVVTKDDIKNRGYINLIDVLRDLPGMQFDEWFYSEQGTIVPVRGVQGNNKIIVMINGMRVNAPGGEDFQIRNDFGIRNAEQIEVIYGPGATLYGQDAMSCVINIITNKGSEDGTLNIWAGAGKNSYTEGTVVFAKEFGSNTKDPLRISGLAQYLNSTPDNWDETYPEWYASFKDILINTGNPPDVNRWNLNYSGQFRLENDKSSIQMWYRESKRSASEGAWMGTMVPEETAIWRDRAFVTEMRSRATPGEKLSIESSLLYSFFEIDESSKYVFPISATDLFLRDNKYGIGNGATLEEKIDYQASEKLSFIGGILLSYKDIVPKMTVIDGADPHSDLSEQSGMLSYITDQNQPDSIIFVPRALNELYYQYGAYLESQYKVTDKLKLIVGLRVDGNTRYSDKPVLPRFSAIYSGIDKLTLKYIFAKSYVSPAPYFENLTYDAGGPMNVPNHNLTPETGTSNEINASFLLNHLFLGASIFYNNYQNLLMAGESGLDVNIKQREVWVQPGYGIDNYADSAYNSPRVLRHSANQGNSQYYGMDLTARYNMGSLSSWASYSYVDGKTTDQKNVDGENIEMDGLNILSKHNVRFGITYKALKNKLTITPSLWWRSTPDNPFPDAATWNITDEYENPYAVNLFASYDVFEKLNIYMRVNNLTNHKYATKGISGFMPQETIFIMGGLNIRL